MPNQLGMIVVAAGLFAALASGTAAAEDVDGTYRGTYSGTGACPGGGPAQMAVHDRALTRSFGPNISLTATVGPDGAFTGQAGQTTMTGTIRGGHADLTIASSRGCTVHQIMDKQPAR